MSKYLNIQKDPNRGYGIYKIGPACHRIVKNLKDYTDEQEAIGNLMKLLNGEITEQDLTGSKVLSDAESGKLGNRINVLEAALECIRNNLVQVIGDSDQLETAAREAVKKINDLVE